MKNGLTGCFILSVFTFLLWGAPNHPQAGNVTMPPGKFNSLSYAPYQAWQSPLDKTYPTGAEVAKDLKLVATRADGIRTYSAIEGKYDIAKLAKQYGLHVWLGIWLSSNPVNNAKEMAAGIAEANAHPDTITRVIVGNEVLLRRDLSVHDLCADIDYVHARVKQPVAYADVTDFWRQFPQVAPHVDIVMVHFLPYWEDKPLNVTRAIAEIKSQTETFKAMFPGKIISIGETGWPSRGRWREDAAPSRVNEAVFLRKFVTLADTEHVDYNLIEAFDQNWKYEDEGVAGANWGIWNAHRVPKFPLNGPVVERPDWPWYAALGMLGGWLLFAAAGFRDKKLLVPAFALGNAYAFACMGTLPMLYDGWLLLDAAVNLSLQAVFAVLVIRRAGALLRDAAFPAPITGAQTLAALRAGSFWIESRNDLFQNVNPPLIKVLEGDSRLRSNQGWFDLNRSHSGRGRFLLNYDSLWFIFLASAAIFEAMLVFDGRYRDAPLSVFIVPVIAAVLRFWLRDHPRPMGWEEILSACALALLALVDIGVEGLANLDFLTWNIAALIMATPVILSRRRPL